MIYHILSIKNEVLSYKHHRRVSFGKNNKMRYVTIHQTGNTDRGANARAHANLQRSMGVNYGWHWQVDDKEAIKSFDHRWSIWHAGDGRGLGNTASVAIEICVNRDGNYNQAVENGAKLAAYLLLDLDLKITDLRQHHDWSGKDCPHEIRASKNGISWYDFVEKVKFYYNYLKGDPYKPEKKPKPEKTIDQIAHEVINGKYGNGKERVDKLTKLGYNYSEVQRRVNQLLHIGQTQIYHTVKKGDTLYGISRKYGVPVNTIARNNHIENINLIIDGTKLFIK